MAADKTRPGKKGFVVLGKAPGANAWHGVVEHSFGMDTSPDTVRFWWTGTAYDNLFGMKFKLNGRKDAKRYLGHFRDTRPIWSFEMFDVADPDIPIVIDWERWHDATAKFDRRNPHFEMRDFEAELLADANADYSSVQLEEIARGETA